jgi:hypothetical protein
MRARSLYVYLYVRSLSPYVCFAIPLLASYISILTFLCPCCSLRIGCVDRQFVTNSPSPQHSLTLFVSSSETT